MKMETELKIPHKSTPLDNALQLLQGHLASNVEMWGKGGEVG